MFERYTERARQVVVLAQEEARKRKHDHIGPTHILMGLIREEEGLASRALHALGVGMDLIAPLLDAMPVAVAADPPGQPIPFTATAQKVLENALREALALGHNYVGTEHILLSLGRDPGDLGNLNVHGGNVQDAVLRLLAGPPKPAAKVTEHAGDYLRLTHQQAAALFRLHVNAPLGGCQFENGRMRWWLKQGLCLEQFNGEWRLYVVTERGAPA